MIIINSCRIICLICPAIFTVHTAGIHATAETNRFTSSNLHRFYGRVPSVVFVSLRHDVASNTLVAICQFDAVTDGCALRCHLSSEIELNFDSFVGMWAILIVSNARIT